MTALNRRNALATLAAVPAVSLPAIAAAAEPDPIFGLLEAHKTANEDWARACDMEGDFYEKFASQHPEALAAQKAERAESEAEWANRRERAKPVAEQIYRSIPDDDFGFHRGLVIEIMREMNSVGSEQQRHGQY
jgi:hypothetical protein